MNNHGEIVAFLWSVADLIRDTFKRGEVQDVILPLTVLRRVDCVLAPTKPAVLEANARLRGKLDAAEVYAAPANFRRFPLEVHSAELLLEGAA